MTVGVLLLLSYVVGATPTSLWVGRALHGVDLREVGSGNLGATNTFRVLGPGAATPVMVVDVLKGYLPVVLLPPLAGLEGSIWVLALGAAAILGHVFSFWVGFRGGKGVATSAGVFLALAPLPLLITVGVWAALVFITRIVSVASITAALLLPVLVLLMPTPRHEGDALVVFTAFLGAFVIWAHRTNIRRLLRGEESRFARSRRSGAALADQPVHDTPEETGERP